MTPPNAVSPTNVEDEIRAMRPVAIIPVIENGESEDESSVNVNVENEVPPEGEPLGEEPEEAPMVEETDDDSEENEEDSDSSINPLTFLITSPISTHVEHDNPPLGSPVAPTELPNNNHVGESSRGTVRPRQDDPYMSFIPRQRTSSPERVPYHTTPAMYSLSGDPYRMPTSPAIPSPNPDATLQMHRQLQIVQGRQRAILDRVSYLEDMAVIESERTRLRLDGFEVEIMRLRSMIRSISARLTRLEDVNPGRRM